MTKRRIMRVATAIVAAVIIAVAVIWYARASSEQPLLTREEAIQEVQYLYEGEIVQAALEQEVYRMELESEFGLYDLEVDAYSGNIMNIKRVKVYEPSVTPPVVPPVVEPQQPGSGEEPPPEESSGTVISRSDAVKLALEQVPGNVEDVEYKSRNGSRYYLIEIDTDAGDAVVQINAISGVVMSITWDKEEDE